MLTSGKWEGGEERGVLTDYRPTLRCKFVP